MGSHSAQAQRLRGGRLQIDYVLDGPSHITGRGWVELHFPHQVSSKLFHAYWRLWGCWAYRPAVKLVPYLATSPFDGFLIVAKSKHVKKGLERRAHSRGSG